MPVSSIFNILAPSTVFMIYYFEVFYIENDIIEIIRNKFPLKRFLYYVNARKSLANFETLLKQGPKFGPGKTYLSHPLDKNIPF